MKMEEWRRYDNEDRLHGIIGKKSPISSKISMAHHRDKGPKTLPSGGPKKGCR
jgi:hypothetical protein